MLSKAIPMAFWAIPKLTFNPLLVVYNEWRLKKDYSRKVNENILIESARKTNYNICRKNEQIREDNEQKVRENLKRSK